MSPSCSAKIRCGRSVRGRTASGLSRIRTTLVTATDADEVAAVRPDGADVLVGYYTAVAAVTAGRLATVTAAHLDRIVDRRGEPPVTLGVRLVSVADDDISMRAGGLCARPARRR